MPQDQPHTPASPEAGPFTDTDAVIIGAGPAGLYLAFQLGLLEVRAHVIDALPFAGGQCAALYGDKPIYDIPGVPVCTGEELTASLLTQIKPFAPALHLGQLVNSFERQPDGHYVVHTTEHVALRCKAVFIAAGAGAFQPRCPSLEGLATYTGTQLQFHLPDTLPASVSHVLILGDGEAALRAALDLCARPNRPATITLMHRRDVFVAEPATQEAFRAQVASNAIQFLAAQPIAIEQTNGQLSGLRVLDNQGNTHSMPLDLLVVLQGLSPKLGPIANWGMALERKHLPVKPDSMATELPGIYALGDIVTYPGKKKLIACGFHEAIIAAFSAINVIRPENRVILQYTSSSSHLQRLLGVAS